MSLSKQKKIEILCGGVGGMGETLETLDKLFKRINYELSEDQLNHILSGLTLLMEPFMTEPWGVRTMDEVYRKFEEIEAQMDSMRTVQ